LPVRRPIIAFGGGKGGVGKSFMSSNVSIFLAASGLKTAAIDADLGGANLHTMLGMQLPKVTLEDFISHKTGNLHEILVKSPIENLFLGAGVIRDLAAPNFKHSQKTRLIRNLRNLDFDVIVMDLGAGTSYNVLDFFAAADLGVLVTLPEPTAVENCYRFLKSSFFRHLRAGEKSAGLKELLDSAMSGNHSIVGPFELIRHVEKSSPESARRYREELEYFRPGLVINQVRTSEDRALKDSITSALRRFYGFKVRPLGEIAYEDSIWQSIRNRTPLMTGSQETLAARDTMVVCRAIGDLVSQFRTLR
jgi:flagellar biosynthesis protein FlhG